MLGAWVVLDRSHVATQIDARKSAYSACAAGFRGVRLQAARQQSCGWRQLSQVARGDLIGLPFLALAVALTLVLVARISHAGADAGLIKMGEPRADDPLI